LELPKLPAAGDIASSACGGGMTEASTSAASDLLSTAAAQSPAPAAPWQPAGMPVTSPEYGHPEAVAARARIDELKADKAFYQKLQAESDRGVSGEARQEWNRLHAVGFPSPTSISSQADIDSQAAARAEQHWNSYLSTIKQDIPHLTEQQEEEIRAGVTNQVSRDWALREKDRMIKDPSFRRKLLDGGRAEREDWARVNAILRCAWWGHEHVRHASHALRRRSQRVLPGHQSRI
jgi:hypothetical protein